MLATDNPMRSSSQPRLGTIKVECFTESRARRCYERHNLGLVYIPLFCVATYWDRPDWMLWDRYKEGYKPVGLDMAEAIQQELDESGMFQKVLGPEDEGTADYVLRGDIQEFRLKLNPHLCGGSLFLAPFIGSIGIPLGNWKLSQKINVKLSKANQPANPVWQKDYSTVADGVMAAYYGRNPMQFGYPYEESLLPVLQDLKGQIITLPAK